MKQAMAYIKNNYCIKCNTHNLECFDSFNNPIKLSNIMTMLEKGKPVNLNNKQLLYMRCRKCGERYDLFWKEDEILPYPLTNNIDVNIFLDNYFGEVED